MIIRKLFLKAGIILLVISFSLLISCQKAEKESSELVGKAWIHEFDVPTADFQSSGSNQYFILEPGYQLVLEGEDDGDIIRMEMTVLSDTKIIGEIETRILEEKESVNGEVVEISRNFFAISSIDSSVYYFGEEVDYFEEGEISDHEGAWLAGAEGAKFGLIMPGQPAVGYRFYEEYAPGKAMDKGEIAALDIESTVPAGNFTDCLKVEETSDLNVDEKEYKIYAPGIGLIVDESLKLVKYGYLQQ